MNIAVCESVSGPFHTTQAKFVNDVFTLKTQQMFSVHTTPERFENATINGHFGVVFEENSKCVPSTPNSDRKPAFSNPSGLNSVFEELRFRDGLMWIL